MIGVNGLWCVSWIALSKLRRLLLFDIPAVPLTREPLDIDREHATFNEY